MHPSETLQTDLVGPKKLTVYPLVLDVVDVFKKYLFAIPFTGIRADTFARALTSIFFKHSYLSETFLSDVETSFVCDFLHESTQLLEILLQHDSLKHPQKVGVVERFHSALKRLFVLNTNYQWHDWSEYVQLAAFFYKKSYHSPIGCSPTVLLHVREPKKPIDL